MPQVYWQAAHNPESQLRRCVSEFQALKYVRPILPTGPVYRYGDWMPTVQDIVEFLNTAQTLKLNAVNFFTWDYRSILSSLWNAISSYNWTDDQTPDIAQQYITALNSRNAATAASLYRSDAVHITAAQTVQGTSAILNWYTKFFNTMLPNAQFILTGSQGTGNTRHFTWKASSSAGNVSNGSDTIGLINGKIVYHYCFFSVQT